MKALLFIGIALVIDMIIFTLIIPYIIKMVVQRYRSEAYPDRNFGSLDISYEEAQDVSSCLR